MNIPHTDDSTCVSVCVGYSGRRWLPLMTSNVPCVQVELFGVPQLLIHQRVVEVRGGTLADIATALAESYPSLVGTVIDEDGRWLLGGYTFVVDECFTRDPGQALSADSSVLLVTSVAGG